MTAQKKLPRISGAFVITNFKFSLFSSGCFRFRFENALYCPTGRYDNRVLEHAARDAFPGIVRGLRYLRGRFC